VLSVALKKQRGSFALNVAFQAPTPGLVALFGRSGCGKSTLVNMLAGLLQPDEGRVSLNDSVLYDSTNRVSVAAERRRIGYVFQDSRLFPHFNVVGNLTYGEKRALKGAATARIRLDEIVELLGLSALLDRRPHQLSGGERQRVAVGRALLSQPQLLLLDEPLASLDLGRRHELLPYLERLRDQLSIPMVYVSHQFDEVLRLATYVVLLEAGSVVAQGDLATVSRRPELRVMVGPDSMGGVIEGQVSRVDELTGLARLQVGRSNELIVAANGLQNGQRIRVQLLARDLILATEPPRALSVRNVLEGTITAIVADEAQTQQVEIDIGGHTVLARVTDDASRQLALKTGLTVWVLVKTVSLRGHVFPLAPVASPPVD
jgi:molybdate transport system ATP-binding protein